MDQETIPHISKSTQSLYSNRIIAQKPIAHQIANIFYWVSVIVLLIGMRMIIDPNHRKIGETSHVFITLITFELYMWLLVVLGRWHKTRNLSSDLVRTTSFTMILCGFLFIALNEMYLAASTSAYLLSLLAFFSTLLKIWVMIKIIELRLSVLIWLFLAGWISILALPAPVMYLMSDESRYRAALGLCWLIALFLAGHFILVRKQLFMGLTVSSKNWFQSWYSQWLMLAILLLCSILQAFSVSYVFSDWAYWYFSPIFMTAGVLVICLTFRIRSVNILGWLMLAGAVFYMFISASDPLPQGFPQNISGIHSGDNGLNSILRMGILWNEKFWLHPIYPVISWSSLMFLLAAITVSMWWMMLLAGIGPFAGIALKAIKIVSASKNGKGFGLLILAFVLLGGGVLLQWAQEKWGMTQRNSDQNLSSEGDVDSSIT